MADLSFAFAVFLKDTEGTGPKTEVTPRLQTRSFLKKKKLSALLVELVPYLICRVRQISLCATRLETMIVSETVCLPIGSIGQICTPYSNKAQDTDQLE